MDNVCIICREEMVTGAKRLPCNHIFHTRWGAPGSLHVGDRLAEAGPEGCADRCLVLTPSCLRSWFQRQQTCPTCRMDVLRASLPTQSPPPPEPADQGPPPAAHPPPLLPQPPNCEWPPFGQLPYCRVLAPGWEWEVPRRVRLLPYRSPAGAGVMGRDRWLQSCGQR